MSDHAEGGARRPVRKVAPSNGQAEMAVLGAIILSPDRFHEVAGLVRTDDFLIPAHREIWDAFVHVDAEKKALDVIGIADALRDRQVTARLPEGEMYLLKLTNAVSTAENVMHYARIVRAKSELRQLIAVCTETASRAYAADDPEELAADCLAKLEKIGAYARTGGPSRIGKMVNDVVDEVEKRGDKPSGAYVKIGLSAYDAMYCGLPAGSLVIVAQRPGGGKTGFVVSTLIRMGINGVPTLLFSQEMNKQRIVERALSFTSRIDARKFRRGTIERGDWKDVHRGSKVLFDLPLDIDDRTDLTAELIRAEIRRWCYRVDREAAQQGKERPLKVVAIDSMSLTVPEKPGKNRMDDVTKMSREFKNLAQGLNVTIILIVHLSREIEKGKKPRKPKLSDLRESGALEQDADVVIFPWREPGTRSAGGGPVEALLLVPKARDDVEGGEIPVQWDGRFTAFYDAPEDPGV